MKDSLIGTGIGIGLVVFVTGLCFGICEIIERNYDSEEISSLSYRVVCIELGRNIPGYNELHKELFKDSIITTGEYFQLDALNEKHELNQVKSSCRWNQ